MVELVTVLGSTGSIGTSTLDVIARHTDRYQVYALTAHTRFEQLLKQCLEFSPRYAVITSEQYVMPLKEGLAASGSATEVLAGPEALAQVAEAGEVDIVMAAIIGAAGLESSLAAAKAGKKILLANKEALVISGSLFMDAVKSGGACLLPVDSEHNAIFQCMPAKEGGTLGNLGVRKILLTGSGGPFRSLQISALGDITPEQACRHPNWQMGRKISVDSATMMNKGLELIEACLLFDCHPDQVDIVIHPQSIIHSMVEYVDGSILAQMGNPDMRTPIAHALAWPERIETGVESLDLVSLGRLDFEAPDTERFPALKLSREACETGGTAPAIMSAANEVAVQSFLDGGLSFTGITDVVTEVMGKLETLTQVDALDQVLEADHRSREQAKRLIAKL